MDQESAPKMSRRTFLKRAVAGAGVAGVAALGITQKDTVGRGVSHIPDILPKEPPVIASPRPEGLPEDVLSDEQLKEAHITIYQTPETQLYLRKDALNLPVFKDAVKRQNGGVQIVLVNSDNLSWNAVNELPPHPREVWQQVTTNPENWTVSKWESLGREYEIKVKFDLEFKSFWERFLTGVADDRTRLNQSLKFAREQISSGYGQDVDFWKGQADYYASRLDSIAKDEEQYREAITREEGVLAKDKNIQDILRDGNRTKAIEYFSNHGGPQGQFIGPHNRFFDNSFSYAHSDWVKQAHLYICVGGEYKPDPDQSYPRPDEFEVGKYAHNTEYSVYAKDGKLRPGYIARHEASHYKNSSPGSYNNENEADKGALTSITAAWNTYQETGSNEGYSFVFVNDRGITFTKGQNTNTSNTL